MKYIDIHGHVNFSEYDSDREAVIARAQEAGVTMISVGTELESSRSAVELAHKHDDMYATIGLHPIESASGETLSGEALEDYRNLAKDPKTVAIGECGLDYFRVEADVLPKQREQFEHMIDLANEVGKPLMLHIRNGGAKSAYMDAFDILKNRAKVKGNLHFFAGTIEEAKPFLDLGYTFSFTGVITFARNYDDVIRYLPADRIMTETDCPFVTPVPNRGKRNEPSYVIEVVRKMAEIRQQNESVLAEQVLKNAQDIFGIS